MQAGVIGAAALAGAAAVPARAQEEDAGDEDAAGLWVAELGKVKDLNEKEPVLIKAEFKDKDGALLDTEKIFVRWERIRRDEGRWVVLSAICQHLKCKVEYQDGEEIFRCPCHGSEYDLDGTVTKKPSRKDLPDYSDMAIEEDGMLKLTREPE